MLAPAGGVAQQVDKHPEVVLRDAPGAGNIVAKVPNGEALLILQTQGDQMQVQWNAVQPPIQGWAKATNIKPSAPAPAPYAPVASVDLVTVAHNDGRPDVVFFRTREAAERAGARPDGKILSGTQVQLVQSDPLGAGGFACLLWNGGEVFVRQAHLQGAVGGGAGGGGAAQGARRK